MSWKALAWAAKCRVKHSADKLILLGLAERHNEEAGTAYPSVDWLCEFGSLNRKTVITALGRLEAAGLISDSGERFGRTAQVKAYRLHVETVPKSEPLKQSQNRNSSKNGTVPKSAPKESQKRDTEPYREPVSPTVASQPTETRARAHYPPPPGVPDPIWVDFLKSPKRRKAGMSDTAYRGICNNLDELAEHGFPPGKMIALAVERGWVTVKLEWAENDRSTADRRNGGRLGGPRPDPTLALHRAANAAIAHGGEDYH